MFALASLTETLRLQPVELAGDWRAVCIEHLEGLFCNRVLPGIGLAITVYDIQHISEAVVIPADGAATVTVRFRLMVFKPSAGEVLVGRVKQVDAEAGLRLSLDFFEDVWLPPALMRKGMVYDASSKAWVWIYRTGGAGGDGDEGAMQDAEEGEGEGEGEGSATGAGGGQRLLISRGDKVRFVVSAVHFQDMSQVDKGKVPGAGTSTSGTSTSSTAATDKSSSSKSTPAPAPAPAPAPVVKPDSRYIVAGGDAMCDTEQKDTSASPRTGAATTGSGSSASSSSASAASSSNGAAASSAPNFLFPPARPAPDGMGTRPQALGSAHASSTALAASASFAATYASTGTRLSSLPAAALGTCPMAVIGSIAEDGTGRLEWWEDEEEEQQQAAATAAAPASASAAATSASVPAAAADKLAAAAAAPGAAEEEEETEESAGSGKGKGGTAARGKARSRGGGRKK